MIKIKRVYDVPAKADGRRILVERLWPRGVKKKNLKLDAWFKELAPSAELRKWFGHTPAKWKEFQRRYTAELLDHPESWHAILEAASNGNITLLYSSHDATHNNVVALKDFLVERAVNETAWKGNGDFQRPSQTRAQAGRSSHGS